MKQKESYKKPFYNRPWFIVLVVVVVVGLIGGALGAGSKTEQTGSSDSETVAAEKTEADKAIKVSSNDLYNAYEDNEVSADGKYKGKTLKITGIVGDIGKDIVDTPYVTFKAKDEYGILTVQCMFPNKDEAKKLKDLNKGKKITIIGECTGMSVNVLIEDCKIVK